MIPADILVYRALLGGLRTLRANSSKINEFLGLLAQLDPQGYAQAVQWLSTNDIPVILGWPQEPPLPNLAVVALTLGEDSENEQFLGGGYLQSERLFSGGDGDDDNDDRLNVIAETEYAGSLCDFTVNATIYSANQSLCVWVAQACRWALLAQRPALTTYDLARQRIRISDLGPDSRWQPSYVFRRNLAFSATAPAVTETTYTTLLRSVEAIVIDNRNPLQPYLLPEDEP